MKFDKTRVVQRDTKTRVENNKEITYVITNESYEDEYGSFHSNYHAWRLEDGQKPKLLTCETYALMESDVLKMITFGEWKNCPTCGHRHFVKES